MEAEQTTAVDAALAVVEEQENELRDRLQQDVETAIEQALAGAVRESGAAATALSESLAEALAALVEDRAAVAPLVEACKDTVEPVQEMVANVREAAAQAGLSW
jgi:hypothetical protein